MQVSETDLDENSEPHCVELSIALCIIIIYHPFMPIASIHFYETKLVFSDVFLL